MKATVYLIIIALASSAFAQEPPPPPEPEQPVMDAIAWRDYRAVFGTVKKYTAYIGPVVEGALINLRPLEAPHVRIRDLGPMRGGYKPQQPLYARVTGRVIGVMQPDIYTGWVQSNSLVTDGSKGWLRLTNVNSPGIGAMVTAVIRYPCPEVSGRPWRAAAPVEYEVLVSAPAVPPEPELEVDMLGNVWTGTKMIHCNVCPDMASYGLPPWSGTEPPDGYVHPPGNGDPTGPIYNP